MIPVTQTNQFIPSQTINMSLISKIALFVTLLFIFLIPWGNYVWDGFTRIFGIASLGLGALVVVAHGTHRRYSFFHLFLLMLGSWVLLTLMWSPNFVLAKESASTVFQLMLMSLVITLLIDTKDKILLAYQAYVFGASTGSLIIFYNYLNGIESANWGRYSLRNFEADGVGIILALAVPMAAYLTTQYKNKLLIVLSTLAIPICFFAIFLNATRTASIASLFGIAYWLYAHRKANFKFKLLLLSFFIASIVAIFTFSPKVSVDRVFSSGEAISSGTLNGRTIIWAASLEQWAKSPIIGSGIGGLSYVLTSSHVEYVSAHNTFIQVLVETGIIGFSFYLLLILSILYYIQKTPLNERRYLISFLLVVIACQLTMNTLFDKEMWFSLTMLAIHAHISNEHIHNS